MFSFLKNKPTSLLVFLAAVLLYHYKLIFMLIVLAIGVVAGFVLSMKIPDEAQDLERMKQRVATVQALTDLSFMHHEKVQKTP